jgi:hypothetical protein
VLQIIERTEKKDRRSINKKIKRKECGPTTPRRTMKTTGCVVSNNLYAGDGMKK